MPVLENDALKITVADRGAEPVSVWDKENGCERLWTAEPAVWNRHAPILFPFVGRVTEGKYRVGGKEFSMPTQHGFARDMLFACTEEAPDRITHRLAACAETLKDYPFDFALTVQHRLCTGKARQLEIRWTVENRGIETMFYAIGGHPGFLMPKGTAKEDCFLLFPGQETLQYISANAAGFALPEEKHSLPLEDGFIQYRDDSPDTWIFEDGQVPCVGIAGPDRKPYVVLHCAQFPMLAVWAAQNGPFICLEPWFGRTDDEGFTGSIDRKKDIRMLPAGGKEQFAYQIDFLS